MGTNDTLYEVNYKKSPRELESEIAMDSAPSHSEGVAKVLPTLPHDVAYTAAVIDKYGYLSVFGGEIADGRLSSAWLRVEVMWTGSVGVGDVSEGRVDVVWSGHYRHNHNEQWALVILVLMLVCVCFWLKCVPRIRMAKRRGGRVRGGGGGLFSDGTPYDYVTGTSEQDDLEDEEEDGDLDDDYAVRSGLSSSENAQAAYLNGIVGIASDLEAADEQVAV